MMFTRHLIVKSIFSLHSNCQFAANISSSRSLYHRSVLQLEDECWKCGNNLDENILFCSQENCRAIQRISGAVNPFRLFNLPEIYEIDPQELSDRLKSLQRVLHPDRFAMKTIEERDASATASSAINQSYQVFCVGIFFFLVN